MHETDATLLRSQPRRAIAIRDGVAANARLTGAVAAALLVLLDG